MFSSRGRGDNKPWRTTPYSQHNVGGYGGSGRMQVSGHGGYSSPNQQAFWGGNTGNPHSTQFGGGNFAQQDQPGPFYSPQQQNYGAGGYGSGQGGREEFGRYHPYARGGSRGGVGSEWRGGGMGREGYEKGKRGSGGGGWSFGRGGGGVGYEGGEQAGVWFGNGSGYGGVAAQGGGAGGLGFRGEHDWTTDVPQQQHVKVVPEQNNELQASVYVYVQNLP